MTSCSPNALCTTSHNNEGLSFSTFTTRTYCTVLVSDELWFCLEMLLGPVLALLFEASTCVKIMPVATHYLTVLTFCTVTTLKATTELSKSKAESTRRIQERNEEARNTSLGSLPLV
jgi:hypothetical protein